MEIEEDCLGTVTKDSGPNFRLVARLDVKLPNLVKGIQFEGLRKIGDPNEFARKYYLEGADELFLDDIVASLFGRNSLFSVISEATRDIFIPITVSGGIRSVQDVELMLRSGADKIAINTAAVRDPSLIKEIANNFGSQCVVVSIQAKKSGSNSWEVFTENGRQQTGISVRDWLIQVQDMGAGEILVTSIDRDGTRKGLDMELCAVVSEETLVPVVVGGGVGNVNHVTDLTSKTQVSGVAIGSALHSSVTNFSELRTALGIKSRVEQVG